VDLPMATASWAGIPGWDSLRPEGIESSQSQPRALGTHPATCSYDPSVNQLPETILSHALPQCQQRFRTGP
jgi:hypothetical protein